MKKGLRKIAKLTPMNTRFQRGAVEITLDLIKGLSHEKFKDVIISSLCGNYIRPD